MRRQKAACRDGCRAARADQGRDGPNRYGAARRAIHLRDRTLQGERHHPRGVGRAYRPHPGRGGRPRAGGAVVADARPDAVQPADGAAPHRRGRLQPSAARLRGGRNLHPADHAGQGAGRRTARGGRQPEEEHRIPFAHRGRRHGAQRRGGRPAYGGSRAARHADRAAEGRG